VLSACPYLKLWSPTLAKKRVPIPKADAAKVLFSSDRTCCVCRVGGKRVQIHHIDDDPSNNEFSNLSVLCFECHGETQLSGGFGRQFDSEQVRLYRDDWHRIVADRRVENYRETRDDIAAEGNQIRYLTSLIETLREKKDYITLANVYDDMDNNQLRDKYIDLALESDDSDWLVIYLRSMQDRRDLIPADVAERRLSDQLTRQDWPQRARTLVNLGRHVEAAHDYTRHVFGSLERGRIFTSAYYLKELFEEDLVDRLFEAALQEATDEGDLWWQVRCLQELEWDSELKDLLLSNEEEIRSSGDLKLLPLLLRAKGDDEGADKASIEFNASLEGVGERVIIRAAEDQQQESSD
jgi:hypothetical protein